MLFHIVASFLTGTTLFAVRARMGVSCFNSAGLTLIAAVLWPVLLVGLLQLLVVVTARRLLSGD